MCNILDFNGQVVAKDATGCSLKGHLVWIACCMVVERGFEAREGRNIDLSVFV